MNEENQNIGQQPQNSQMPDQRQGGQPGKPKGFMNTLAYYFGEKAPQLPKGFKEFLVKAAPWISLVALIMVIPILLGMFGIALNWGAYYYTGFSLMTFLILVQIVLQIIALPGLFKRMMNGWNFTFYASVVAFLANLVSGAIVTAIIGTIIAFYILFQVRSYYH